MTAIMATLIDDTIALSTPYSEQNRDRARSVQGGRWHRSDKTWRYALSLEVCHQLREAFGSSLTVAQPLRDWYKGEASKADQRASEARTGDASIGRLPEVAPALASTLRGDQRVAARWVADGWRAGGLLADHPGTGKTLSTIAGVLESGATGPILVLCPRLSVRAVWQRELERWTGETVYVARGTRAKRQRTITEFLADPAERKWLIIVAETLRVKEENDPETDKPKIVGYEYPDLFSIVWSWVIVDESHKMFGSLTVVKGNLVGKGLKRLTTARRLAITGTPFGRGGRITGMFGTLHWLWPDEFTSYWKWVERYFEVEEKTINRAGRKVKSIGRLKSGDGEDKFLRDLGPRILRRTKAESLPNLPEKRRVDLWCEPTASQLLQQKSLVLDAEVVCKSGVITVDGVLAMITRSKQIASGVLDVKGGKVIFSHNDSCKIDMLFQKLEEAGILDGSGDTKIIIASQYNELLEAVQYALDTYKAGAVRRPIPYFKITGSVSDNARDRQMAAFQSDQMDTRIMILNSMAGGVSITLDAADEVHMLDEMWDPGDNEQLEDRAHRASRVHQVTIFRYRTEGSIDEGIANDVEGRRFEQFRVLDQKRGLEFVRALIQGKK